MSATFADFNIDIGTRTHGQFKTKCPRCQEQRRKHPHDRPLSVDIDNGVWTCWHCGWADGLRKGGAVPPAPVQHYERPTPPANPTLRQPGRDFLMSRGIDPDIAEDALVYSHPTANALAFPYTRHGEIIHEKFRSIEDKTFWSTKQTERTVYGYDQCVDSDTVMIVEGELDRLSVLTAGFTPVCSVPDGAPNENDRSDSKLQWLAGCEDLFERAHKVIIATDADGNGQRLADELVRRIGPDKCWRIHWPDGCKDANDVLRIHGAERVGACIASARPEPVEGIFVGTDLEESLARLYREGREKGYNFGYPDFDRHYTIVPGYMTIVTGHASHGKSTALDQLLLRLADRHDWHIGIFSPEQQPLEIHQIQLMEQWFGSPFFDGFNQRMNDQEWRESNEWVSKHFSFILPDNPSVDSILEKARQIIFRYGAKGIVIDPWNELEHSRPANMTETEYVSAVLGKLRTFARNHNVHLWLIAHPTKMPMNDKGEEQIPKLQNINGSVHFRNKADFGLSVFRDLAAAPDEVQIIVTKARRSDLAKLGAVKFRYNPTNKRLQEIGAVTQ